MPALYYVNVTVHVLAAMLWLGEMFFVGLVGASVFRAIEPLALRQRVFHQLGRRFRRMAWWTIGVLVVTGAVNLYYRGWLHWRGVLDSHQFWNTSAGHALAVKLSIVALMIAVSVRSTTSYSDRARAARHAGRQQHSRFGSARRCLRAATRSPVFFWLPRRCD